MEVVEDQLPASLYSLDPFFAVPVKIFLSKLNSLPTLDAPNSVLSLYGHPITDLEIVGTITGRDSFVDKFSLLIDDSTGTLRCSVWMDDVSWTLREGQMQDLSQLMQTFELGDLVRVIGKIHVLPFKMRDTNLELSVSCIRREQDLNMELLHRLDVMALDRLYRVPFVIPTPINQHFVQKPTLEIVITEHLGINPVPKRLDQASLEYFRNHLPAAVSPFSVDTLLENSEIAEAAAREVTSKSSKGENTNAKPEIQKVLQRLSDQGHIIEDPGSKSIEFSLENANRVDMGETIVLDSDRPNAQRPWILVSSDLLAPICYFAICDQYPLKVKRGLENRKAGLAYSAFFFGIEVGKIAEYVHISTLFKQIKNYHILLALNTLIDLDLIYCDGSPNDPGFIPTNIDKSQFSGEGNGDYGDEY
jgi:hypothetical protein